MRFHTLRRCAGLCLVTAVVLTLSACGKSDSPVGQITQLAQLADKTFAVPTGTAADKLVLSKFPQAKFQYYNSVLDAAMATQASLVVRGSVTTITNRSCGPL